MPGNIRIPDRLLVAVGGNAIHPDDIEGTAREQKAIAVNFDMPEQRYLDRVTLRELRALQAEGHFPPGSMGPKVEAAIRFLEGGGKRVIVAHLDDAMAALKGEAGTHIVADDG